MAVPCNRCPSLGRVAHSQCVIVAVEVGRHLVGIDDLQQLQAHATVTHQHMPEKVDTP